MQDDIETLISYKSAKLCTKFPVKDKADFQHRPKVAYYGKSLSKRCKDSHTDVWGKDLEIFGKNCKSNFKRKIKEPLSRAFVTDTVKTYIKCK